MQVPAGGKSKEAWMPALTGVRFFLALWVLLFHNCEELSSYVLLFAFLSKGYVAVSAFFVLSGMVLVYNYAYKLETATAVKQFFKARFVRLYPMYLLSVVLALPLYFWYQYQTNSSFFVTVTVVTLVTLLGIQSWYRGWVDQLNPPSWSLSAEAFFYSIFPLLNRRLGKISTRSVFIILLLLASFNIFFIGQFINASESDNRLNNWIHPSVFPLFHVVSFIIGMCFGYLGLVHKRMHYGGGWGRLALPLIVVMIICMNLPQLSFIEINSGGYALLFGIFFLMLGQSNNAFTKLLSLKWMVLLGESSYALYLLHLPLRTYASLLLQKMQFSVHPHVFLTFYAGIAISASVVCFLYIERPLTSILRKRLLENKSSMVIANPAAA